jgi:acyl carrier protein
MRFKGNAAGEIGRMVYVGVVDSSRPWPNQNFYCQEVFMSIEDKVKKIIAEKLSVDIEEIVPEASFVDDLGADSLDLVELIMSMEEEFDIDISDEDAEKLVTFKDVIEYIKANS